MWQPRNPLSLPIQLATGGRSRIVNDDEESCIHHRIASDFSNPEGVGRPVEVPRGSLEFESILRLMPFVFNEFMS